MEVPEDLEARFNGIDEFYKDLKAKATFSTYSKFDSNDLVGNLRRTGKLMSKLGQNPNLIFNLENEENSKKFSKSLGAYYVFLFNDGKSPNTAKAYMNCIRRFIRVHLRIVCIQPPYTKRVHFILKQLQEWS